MSARILLVEDEEPNRDMLQRRLERRGFTVQTAENGQIACDLVLRDRPDLVLMDWHMPVMDGLEATRRIRECPETRDVPIVAITARAMAEDRAQLISAGCDECATKPVDFNDLLEKIASVLSRRAAH